MNNGVFFLHGLLLAGLVGMFSTFISWTWQSLTKRRKRIFSDLPKPKIAKGALEADIQSSPIRIVIDDSLMILLQLILEAALFVPWGFSIWLLVIHEVTSDYLFGIFIAFVISFFAQNGYKSWKEIGNLQKKIFNGPTPGVNKIGTANDHYVNAKPSAPAFKTVIDSLWGIITHFTWLTTSIVAIVLTVGWVLNIYVFEGTLKFPVTQVFGT